MTTHAPTFASQRLTSETRELLIPLKPPLPRRLSPRRQPPAQRFAWLLIAAVAGAVICGMVLMQARYGVDVSDVSR